MKRCLKILNMLDIPWHSALTEYALLQSKALTEKGHRIFFALPEENIIFRDISSKFKTIRISERKKILNPHEIIKLTKFIKENSIDILNVHTGRMQTLGYILSLINPEIKLIRTKSDAKTVKKSFTYSKISTIICGSKYIENMYRDFKLKSKIETVYLSYPEISARPIKKEKPFRITIIGRLDPVKGHANFIKAGLSLVEKRKDLQFIIAGRESKIKWENILPLIPYEFRRYFRYLGYVEDVYSLMAESHIGVIASLGSEAVSRVAAEWMNAERPVISSDAGCLPEIIEKDFIFPRNSPQILALKMEEMLDFEKIENAGKKNKQRFLNLFSYTKFSQNINAVFESLK